MAISEKDKKYIESRGGKVGVVTEKEARELEAKHDRGGGGDDGGVSRASTVPTVETVPAIGVEQPTPEQVEAGKKVMAEREEAKREGATPEQVRAGREALTRARAEQAPRGFEVPEGATVVERTAQGEPSVYKVDGKRVYAPGSTMYQMGFETEAEYIAAQRKDAEKPRAPYITIEEGGQLKHIPATEESIKGYNWKSEKQYQEAWRKWAEQSTIAEAQILTLQRDYTRLPDGQYVRTADLNAMPTYYRDIALERGLKVVSGLMKADLRAFEKRHIQLRDGKWVAIKEWNKLPDKYQTIGIRQGYDAMVGAIEAEQARFDKIKSDLQQFRIKEPSARLEYPEGGAPFEYYERLEQYDLAGALRKGMSPDDLKEVFPPAAIKAAQEFNASIAKVAKAETLYREKLWRNIRTGEVIADDEYQRLMIIRPTARNEFVREQPALILPADPKWKELKDRPKDDPQRQAYVRQWQDKVIDFATGVSIITLPYTMGGIGVVGKALTIPKVATWAFQLPRFMAGVTIEPIAIAATVFNSVVRSAVYLGKVANLYPPILAASRITDEVRTAQLQTDWQAFDKLSLAQKNEWADKAGFGRTFNKLTDNEKAVVLLSYSKPPDISREQWQNKMGERINDLTFYASQKAGRLQSASPAPISIPATIAGGVGVGVLEGLGYVASAPMLAANLAASVPLGTAPVFATQTIKGMAQFFTKELPLAFALNPYLATGRVAGLFLLSPEAALKLAKGLGARSSLRYVPERAMAMEYSTVRIRFDKIGEFAKLSPAERMRITEQIISRLLKGEKSVTIKGVRASIEIKNVPYQQVVGNTVWHFTPDIRPFNKGQVPIKGKIFASPQAAMRFGVATSMGKVGTHAGLVEIRVPDKFRPKMIKLLRQGEAELETVFGKDTVLDPIHGWTGKGISTNVYTGNYPIRRFTILGEAAQVGKLTPATLAKIRVEAGKAALGDLIKGWAGRGTAIKEAFKVDPRINRIDTAISMLRNSKPELLKYADMPNSAIRTFTILNDTIVRNTARREGITAAQASAKLLERFLKECM